MEDAMLSGWCLFIVAGRCAVRAAQQRPSIFDPIDAQIDQQRDASTATHWSFVLVFEWFTGLGEMACAYVRPSSNRFAIKWLEDARRAWRCLLPSADTRRLAQLNEI